MSKSRREFLTNTSIGLLGVAVLGTEQSQAQSQEQAHTQSQAQSQSQTPPQKPPDLPPGAPPAFGTAPSVGPEVSPLTFSEAEKLVQVEMSEAERVQAATSWRRFTSGAPGHTKLSWSHRSRLIRAGIRFSPARRAVPSVTDLSERITIPALCLQTKRTLRSPRLRSFRAGSNRASSRPHTSRISISSGLRNSIQSCAASSRSRATRRLPRRKVQTRKSPRENIAGRCTASRGARKIFSTPPGFRPLMARIHSEIAFRRRIPLLSRG